LQFRAGAADTESARRILILGVVGVLASAWAAAGAGARPGKKPPRTTTTTSSTTTTTTVPPTTTTMPNGSGGPTIGGCAVFPPNNPWNADVSNYPLHPNSSAYIANILANGGDYLQADFGGGAYGIPFITVGASQPRVPINFTAYGDESDPGAYPVSLNAPIEGGSNSTGDRHVLAVNTATCRLYEMYRAFPRSDHWDADPGTVFDLSSNALRPDYGTSADAAGLTG
jgi:hypothetical protein